LNKSSIDLVTISKTSSPYKNPPLSRKVNQKTPGGDPIVRQAVKGEWPRVAKESPWPDLCEARLWGAAIEKIDGSKESKDEISVF